MSGGTVFGFAVAVGLPLAVFIGALCWPAEIPKGKSVDEIRRRVEEDDTDL